MVEGIAWTVGLDVRGSSANTRGTLGEDEPDPVGRALRVLRGPGAGRWGSSLRAETVHQVSGTDRYREPGPCCFDELERALSSTIQLALLAQLADLAAAGTAQVLVATHSPLLAAPPGARVLLVDKDGLTDVAWDALPLVAHWRAFVDDPRRYLRHL